MLLKTIILISFGMLTSVANAQSELIDLSLEELMQVKVKVATETEKPLNEAAGIISVITAEQIKSLGARDLKDILQTVPGINFGHDIMGNISIIMRGIWSQEGRVLLLIDGLEMNERSYGDLFVANHYPAEQIKRIEIIRGPGSAIYGGFAELGVINITTKDGEDLKGIKVSSSYARTSKDFAQSTNNFMFGQKKGDLDLSVKGSYNNSNFTDRNYTDGNGTTANLGNGNSRMGGNFLNLRSKYKPLYVNYIKDNHHTENIILYGDLENTAGSGTIRKTVPHDYLMDVYQVGFQDNITDQLNLHLYYQNKVQYSYFQPNAKDEVQLGDNYRKKVERKLYGLKTQYQFNKNLNINTGIENSLDLGRDLTKLKIDGSQSGYGSDNSSTEHIENTAIFSQFDFSSSFANVTGGIRYDMPEQFNHTLVPRLGVTKVFGRAHLKLLYAKAFRAPVLENISLNENIKPETTTTGEIEVGYRFSNSLTWNMNLFSTAVKDIIVYSYDASTETELYSNYKREETLGVESELKFKRDRHDLTLNYSTYKVSSLRAPPFQSRKNSSALIGSPQHKIFISDIIKVSDNFEITPSLRYLMATTGFRWNGSALAESRLENQLIANIFGNYTNLFFRGFELGGGINNILNRNIYYAQPYKKSGNTAATPYPGQSREYVMRIGYSKEF